MRCVKCNYPSMSGPYYRRQRHGTYGECLVYRCPRCGYEKTTPTEDQKRREESP